MQQTNLVSAKFGALWWLVVATGATTFKISYDGAIESVKIYLRDIS